MKEELIKKGLEVIQIPENKQIHRKCFLDNGDYVGTVLIDNMIWCIVRCVNGLEYDDLSEVKLFEYNETLYPYNDVVKDKNIFFLPVYNIKSIKDIDNKSVIITENDNFFITKLQYNNLSKLFEYCKKK